MFIEKNKRKFLTLDLNDDADVEEYNKILQNPAIKIINREIVPQEHSEFGEDINTKTTHHIAFLEIEECSF